MLIDTHCHLTNNKLMIRIEEIIAGAKALGVNKIIAVGTSLEDSMGTVEIAEKYNDVHAVVGIYPHENLGINLKNAGTSLQKIISSSKKIVGIGECGIDTEPEQNTRSIKEQTDLFEMQIRLCIKNNLPIVIHNRGADDIVLNILRKPEYKSLRGVAHCFTSSWTVAQEFLKLNFYISFSAIITYPSRIELLNVVRKVPENKFVLETDAPYLPPQGFRNYINEPKYVRITAQKTAETRNADFNYICQITAQNSYDLFNLS